MAQQNSSHILITGKNKHSNVWVCDGMGAEKGGQVWEMQILSTYCQTQDW